jgi:O-methyltransferase
MTHLKKDKQKMAKLTEKVRVYGVDLLSALTQQTRVTERLHETQVAELKSAIAEKAQEAEKLHDECAKLRGESAQLQGEAEKLGEERTQLHSEIAQLHGERAQLHGERAQLHDERVKLYDAVAKQSLEISKIGEQRDSLMHQILSSNTSEKPSSGTAKKTHLTNDIVEVRNQYLDLVERVLIGTINSDPPLKVHGQTKFDSDMRDRGLDWPSLAFSMIGAARMRNLRVLMERVIGEDIAGDFVETGVWRGGASIMAKAVIDAYGDKKRRVYLADSFAGLPPPNSEKYPMDEGLDLNIYEELAVSEDEVRGNFAKMGMLDKRVITVKGWFKDTMPSFPAQKIAILRLDGDLYESTIDPLNYLYDRVSPNGWIIVDDYECFDACKQAVTDFMEARKLRPAIQHIDGIGVFFKKI